ncbi:unnamed protein product [Urochloa decumbens]|uniref:Uncharacterized protein n=1 Tax=Urochloa decumbens TaxID=240449 RepID=A0ABC9AKW1_9POAL
MEPAAAWEPYKFQLSNWSIEEPAAEGWAPASLPMEEYVSIDIFGTCSLQAYVPESSSDQQQLVEYYAAATQHNSEYFEAATQHNPRRVLEKLKREFKADDDMMEQKMHKYPASLRALDECYTVPRIVAIGPYHRHRVHLKQTEKKKVLAAIVCVSQSNHSLQEFFSAVACAADDVLCLYDDDDAMAGISCDDFRHMMFFDACFLVQYMSLITSSSQTMDESLFGFLSPNRIDILHDITLLENQIPWKVVEAVMRFRPVHLEKLSRLRGSLRDKFLRKEKPPVHLVEGYKPPHFLGLFRYLIVGGGGNKTKDVVPQTGSRSFSVSAIELAEIGITLTPNTEDTLHMRINEETGTTIFPELSVPPLALDRDRASFLVNMAALEQCMFKRFSAAPEEDSAVCSYFRLLSVLVQREEDVHELRVRGVLQGGGGLTNEEALRFLTSSQDMRLGLSYRRIMGQIESYKEKRPMKTKLHAFYYNHKKTIAAVVSGIVSVGGIIGTILSKKGL